MKPKTIQLAQLIEEQETVEGEGRQRCSMLLGGARELVSPIGVLVSAPTPPLEKRMLCFIKAFASFLTGGAITSIDHLLPILIDTLSV